MTQPRIRSPFAHAEAVLNHLATSTDGTDAEKLEFAEALNAASWEDTFEAVGAPYSDAAQTLVVQELARRVRAAGKGRAV